MDTITKAIVTWLTSSGSNPAANSAYEMLKTALHQSYAASSDLLEALTKLEQQPTSVGRQTVLTEEITLTQAAHDPALLKLAQTLLTKLHYHKTVALTITGPVLLQLPPRVESFIGRAEELTQLLTCLEPGRVVGVYGPAGIGKSALVAMALRKLAPQEVPPPAFPHGILYHNFHNQPRVDIALQQLVHTLGEDAKPTPYDAAQRALAGRQVLLALDGVEQADDLSGLLGVCGNCGIVVTSRQKFEIVPAWLDLGPLPPAEALTLLQTWGGWPTTDQAASQQIAHLITGLPLALRLAGQSMSARREKAAKYLAWLETTILNSLEPAQRQEQSILPVLEHSLAQLSEPARQALAVAGLLAPVPFETEVIDKGLTTSPESGLLASVRRVFKPRDDEAPVDIHAALAELTDYGLLWHAGKRFEMSHGVIYAQVRQQLTPPPKTIRRLAAYYTALAWEQSSLGREGYTKLDTERPHMMRVLSGCVEAQDWEAAYGLAAAIEDYLDRQGHWAERIIANEVGLMAAWQLGRPSEGDWMGNLGDTYRSMGHAKWAIEHFEQALSTARQRGDRHSEANSLGNLGLAYRDLGQTDRARQYLQQALHIFDKIRSPSADFVRQWLAELEE